MVFGRGEDAARLIHAEDFGLDEDIAELGELFLRYAGKHFVDDKVDVGVWPARVFFGDFVSAEKSRHGAERGSSADVADHAQDLELVFGGEPVAGFGFYGGGASVEEP